MMKDTNAYRFFKDLICDITEDENKEYDFDKTIDNLMSDDDFWQALLNAVRNNLVERNDE